MVRKMRRCPNCGSEHVQVDYTAEAAYCEDCEYSWFLGDEINEQAAYFIQETYPE